MYFNNNILLNPILLNACKAANRTAVKSTHEYIAKNHFLIKKKILNLRNYFLK